MAVCRYLIQVVKSRSRNKKADIAAAVVPAANNLSCPHQLADEPRGVAPAQQVAQCAMEITGRQPDTFVPLQAQALSIAQGSIFDSPGKICRRFPQPSTGDKAFGRVDDRICARSIAHIG